MRNLFPEYYQPDFDALFTECVFVFDTNVLLNLYKYPLLVREEYITILNQLKSRVWLPHQVALEYQNQRISVVIRQSKAYQQTFDDLKKAFDDSHKEFFKAGKKGDVTKDPFMTKISEFLSELKEMLEDQQESLLNVQQDVIRDELDEIFEDRVGSPFDEEHQTKIFVDGAKRYEQRIPPGYSDEKKSSGNKYGDLLIWFQIIEYAKKTSKPIVFVTDDDKEDWWLKVDKKTVQPKPELIREFQQETQYDFYMYNSRTFLEHVSRYLEKQVSEETLEEITNVAEKINEENSRENLSQTKQEPNSILGTQISLPTFDFGSNINLLSPLDDSQLVGISAFHGLESALNNLSLKATTAILNDTLATKLQADLRVENIFKEFTASLSQDNALFARLREENALATRLAAGLKEENERADRQREKMQQWMERMDREREEMQRRLGLYTHMDDDKSSTDDENDDNK